jgi:FixJ family two-component response regulator
MGHRSNCRNGSQTCMSCHMPTSGNRIAVVDDDASVRKALYRLLRASTFEIQTYESGADFLKSVDSFCPNCIILDLHMQGMDGLAVQRQLAESGSIVPVIVITGNDSAQSHSQCLAAGAKAYLSKPIEESLLLTTIRQILEPRQRVIDEVE